MTCTWRGSLPCSRARARARSDTVTASSGAQGALGLGDDLVGEHEHVAGLVGAAAQQRGEVVARAHLGQAGKRPRLHAAHCRSRRASSPRVCAAPPVREPSTTRSAARSSAVSTSRTSERGSATRQRAPAGPGRLLVALAAAGAEARGDRVGRRQQQRVGARAVAVGDDDDVRGAHRAGHELVDLARVQRRAVAGDEQHALVVALERPVDAGRARRGSGRGRRLGSSRRRRPGPAPRRRSRR